MKVAPFGHETSTLATASAGLAEAGGTPDTDEPRRRLAEVLVATIRVTDRGRPKAILGPVPGVGRVALGISQGWIREAEDAEPVVVRRAPAARAIADVLAEDREV